MNLTYRFKEAVLERAPFFFVESSMYVGLAGIRQLKNKLFANES